MDGLRGVMLDSARCIENRDYYRELITFAAARGVNTIHWHFTDDQGCTIQFESIVGIASPHAYSKTEMAELIAFARQHGITIIPELASLGHSRFITRLPKYKHLDEVEALFTGMCPVAPETREILTKLVDETAALFDAPYFHVGLDEANIGHHPLTKEALKTRTCGQIVADHINFMHQLVSGHGRTMMMWGDGLLKDRSIAPLLSRNIVICDWQYAANVDGSSVQYFLDEGFRVVLCPALISHGQTLFPGDLLAMPNLRTVLQQASRKGQNGKGEILGVIETIWQPERYMHDAIWIALDLALAVMREGIDVPIDRVTSNFARDFYGFAPSAAWVDACRNLYELSPLRKEWLAILQMKPADLPDAASLAARLQMLTAIEKAFAESRGMVQSNAKAYDTFCLTVELLTHLYRKAQAITANRISASAARRLINGEQRLISAVEATWDQERFADDANKHAAAHPYFRDNNLLANLHAMHAITIARLQALVAPKLTVNASRKRSAPADAANGYDPLPIPS